MQALLCRRRVCGGLHSVGHLSISGSKFFWDKIFVYRQVGLVMCLDFFSFLRFIRLVGLSKWKGLLILCLSPSGDNSQG